MIFVSLFLGAANLTFIEVIIGLINPETTSGKIVWIARIPRIVGTILAGAALSVSGLVIKNILHNSLAGPNIIGVNSGALFLMVFTLTFFPTLTEIYAVIPAFFRSLIALEQSKAIFIYIIE